MDDGDAVEIEATGGDDFQSQGIGAADERGALQRVDTGARDAEIEADAVQGAGTAAGLLAVARIGAPLGAVNAGFRAGVSATSSPRHGERQVIVRTAHDEYS